MLLSKLVNSTVTALIPTKLKISSVICFTDSTGALGQLFSTEKQTVFVQNRVRKIKNSTTLIHWFHVPGDQNPADCASRGISSASFLSHPLWFHGPPFLLTDELPPQPYSQSIASFVTQVDSSDGFKFVDKHLSLLILHHSSYLKIKRLVAYWIRFLNNSNKSKPKVSGPLTSNELEKALIPIVKCVQRHSFPKEIGHCLQKEEVKSKIRFLSPFWTLVES